MKTLIQTLLGLCLILSCISQSVAGETLQITTGDYPPFLSEEAAHYGPWAQVVREAFALENIQVEIQFLPWARAYNLVKDGERDGTILWGHKAERYPDMYYSDTVWEGQDVFFHLKSYPFAWKTIDDLKGIDIGATLSFTHGKEFDDAEKQGILEVKRVPSDILNFRKMLRGKIQIFPINLDTGYDTLRKNFTPTEIQLVTHHPHPVQVWTYHLLLSKKIDRNRQMLALFNQGLKRLKESGKYTQIIEAFRRGKT